MRMARTAVAGVEPTLRPSLRGGMQAFTRAHELVLQMEDESELLQTCHSNLGMVHAAQEQIAARDNLWNQHRKIQRMLQRSRYAHRGPLWSPRMTSHTPDLPASWCGRALVLITLALRELYCCIKVTSK